MISIETVGQMLDELAEEFPKEFYKDLNGGILLLPEKKLHHKSMKKELYILGEYHRSRTLGRYIAIYYGSFNHTYGHLTEEKFKEKLRSTLKHEFTHHLESLGGERGLEKEDERNIARYVNAQKKGK